ncbi:hypothetical protein HPB52_005738 [Rhipicephalus sanguineus]|uniref:Endonuclease/exonuclease/phosphatase domain-containing protein n=1 Tax=Rhipicephalus sanguineus TaxID=34632 RepID=A0A9D4SMH1_RHISA|nr:hypothetical protein HPB52_005738 [Rhipicephalus sanguineus]
MAKASHRDSLILLGDFNAAHTEWGYLKDAAKGRRLIHATEQHNLTLMNLPNSPTRIGNSVERDTTPDLAFTNADRHTTWQRLEETLGSDHHIISIAICTGKMRRPLGKARITDWNKFRERQQDWSLDNGAPTNATEWEEAIKYIYKGVTKTAERCHRSSLRVGRSKLHHDGRKILAANAA